MSAKELWSLIFCLCGMSSVIPRLVLELLACWKGHFNKRYNAAAWKIGAYGGAEYTLIYMVVLHSKTILE